MSKKIDKLIKLRGREEKCMVMGRTIELEDLDAALSIGGCLEMTRAAVPVAFGSHPRVTYTVRHCSQTQLSGTSLARKVANSGIL